MSVRDNIAFGLKLRKVPKAELNQRVEHAAELLGLTEHLDRKPRNLSGGQRQRVAMGRAIVRAPQAFLMDEPLSNLDAKLRVQMRAEIGRLQQDLKVTTIYVTHDQTEAMTLGHRVAVMKLGVLQQIAPPQELYDRPVNLFVAGFIGSPAMNFLGGTLRSDGRRWSLDLGPHHLEVPRSVMTARPALTAFRDQPVIVGIRPEDIEDAAVVGKVDGATLPGTAELVEPLGADVMAYLAVDVPAPSGPGDLAELAKETDNSPLAPGAGEHSTMIARFNPRSSVAVGDQVIATVNTERLHFFAPDSGTAIWADA
jgi:multiple sugar transport system ATP-binding protein